MTYWIGVSTPEVFEDASRKYNLDGPRPFGFPTGRQPSVEQMEVDDLIVNYMTKRKVFFAVWKIIERHKHIPEYILAGTPFPECVTVIRDAVLPPERGISFDQIKNRLRAFEELKNPKRWSALVRQSARRFKYEDDGEIILNALRAKGDEKSRLAAEEETSRQVTLAEQARRPGQQEFSTMLRRNYRGRCAITKSALQSR